MAQYVMTTMTVPLMIDVVEVFVEEIYYYVIPVVHVPLVHV